MNKKSLGVFFASLLAVSFISAFSIQDTLNNWADAGVFAYVLPFLIVFALIFGILTKTEVFGSNRAVDAILAVAVGLLSLVGDYVPNFFQKIFPYTGVALSVLLVAIILGGLFLTDPKFAWLKYVIFGVGAIAFLFVVYSSFQGNTISANNLWYEYGQALVTLLILAGIIFAVIAASKKKGGSD